MEVSHQLILVGSVLLLLSIFAGLAWSRLGAPLLLVFLLLGMLAGEEGPGGVHFNDFQATYLIGSVALAIILFDGGLKTKRSALKRALWPSLSLATIGVAITAGLVGVAALWLFQANWVQALLIGAIVASTDAAAVFGLIASRKLELHARVQATLEVESGINDPMAVFLTVMLVELAMGPDSVTWVVAALHFAMAMFGGLALGALGGYVLVQLVNRVEFPQGLYPILSLGGALVIFAGAQTVGASGFLAVYVAGLIFGERRHRGTQAIDRTMDAFAWLSQIVMFLVLGLLVTPTALVPTLGPSFGVAAVLMLVARPLAVALCLAPFRYDWRQILFISWVGLRGAVPIFLATVPVLAGAPGGFVFFSVAFVVVLISALVQGWTVVPAARALHLLLPPKPRIQREDFDLPVEGNVTMAGYSVSQSSAAMGVPAAALPLPEGARVLFGMRDNQVAPGPTLGRLEAGDYVMVWAPTGELERLDHLFGPRGQRATEIGEFTLDGTMPVSMLRDLYGVAIEGVEGAGTISDFLTRRLRHQPDIGDRVAVGGVELVVRELDGRRVSRIGLDMEPQRKPWEDAWKRLKRWRGW